MIAIEKSRMSTLPKKTMVCVTVQRTCERLIREGASIAGDAGLSVVHVARNGATLLNAKTDGEALEYLYRIARDYGAEMDMLRSDDVMETIVRFVQRNGIACIVLGSPGTGSGCDFAGALRQRLPRVSVVVVP